MSDWLRIMISAVMFFAIGFPGWYICVYRQRNVRKHPEKAEEENKKRVSLGKPPLVTDELVKVIRKENLLASIRFALISTVLFTLGIVGFEMIFG